MSRPSACIRATTSRCSTRSKRSKRKGNSLVVVEHDEETHAARGSRHRPRPRRGLARRRSGGARHARGDPEKRRIPRPPAVFAHPLQHPMRGERRSLKTVPRWLELRGADAAQSQRGRCALPARAAQRLTGISGSGKSTLMRGVLKPAVESALARPGTRGPAKNGTTLTALVSENPVGETLALRPPKGSLASSFKRTPVRDTIEAVYEVDQSPIGKTSRSTPATYIKVFDEIRALFAQMPLARMRGYTASRFSFNTEGGRCETCTGQGVIKVEMNFLPTSYLPCTECHGTTLQRRHARGALQRPEHRRRDGHDARRGRRVLPPPSENPSSARAPLRHRPRLSPARPAQPHAQRRRSPAAQAREPNSPAAAAAPRPPACGSRETEIDALPPRGADHRPAHGRRAEAPRGAPPPRRRRRHRDRHRAQPRASSPRPITSSTSAPKPAPPAAKSSPAARPRKSRKANAAAPRRIWRRCWGSGEGNPRPLTLRACRRM